MICQRIPLHLTKHLHLLCVFSCYFCCLFFVFFLFGCRRRRCRRSCCRRRVFFFVAFFHFLLSVAFRKITRCMHSRNVCVFFLLLLSSLLVVQRLRHLYYVCFDSEMRAYCVSHSTTFFFSSLIHLPLYW